ncbi:MAG: flippase [Candidatus Abyssobacteria bacterium SURF_17]|uniref:Flippase n=1 Tax=Candidatus Abyssobacteria bacterium SURF_17 TaxID=2093361 RepID=A0A419EP52_9BACT|nr:MAG: flippase [Candidatus Abyssubacteria bacterium SURF_17]
MNKRIARNIFFYGFGKAYDAAAALLLIAIVARYLGRDGFGQYSLIWAAVTLSVIIPESGLYTVLIREASSNLERAPDILKATIQARRVLAFLAIVVVIAIIFASTKDPSVRASACIGSVWILGRLAVGTNSAIFFAYERIQYDTLITIFQSTVSLLSVFAATRLDWGLMGVIGSIAAGASASGIASSFVRRTRFCVAARTVDPSLRKYILKESLPVGGGRALRMTGNRVDTLILAWLRTNADVAIYSGVYNLILRGMGLSVLITRPLFPMISRLAGSPQEREEFQTVAQRSIKLMFVLAVPVCAGLTAVADKVVPLVFGPEFEPSIGVLRILSWVLMFMFPSYMASFVIIAVKQQVYLLKVLGLCVGLNVVLDFILVPSMGYYGPCVATLIAEVLFAFFLWRMLQRMFPSMDLFAGYPAVLLSAGVMGGVVYLLNPLNLIFLIALGPIIYFPCLFLFRAFSRDEVVFFREAVRRRQGYADDRSPD